MLGGYRARIFLATFSGAAVVLLIASAATAISLRRQTYDRIERGLVSEVLLAAELLSHRTAASSTSELQEEARTLGRNIEARVTLIAADGRVVGDSSQDDAGLAQLENHGSRPEVVDSRLRGTGISSRFSATLGIDMLYVAAPVRHPSIATVRLALPLTEIDRQLRTISRATVSALAVSVVGAFAMAWVASALLTRRLNRLAAGARRYAAGEIEAPPRDYEHDEIGTVARVLDDAIRQLAERADENARDRARMQAILAGMAEGVLVVDAEGRVQLVNEAARRMLRIEREAAGRHYLECVRHPSIVALLDAVKAARGSTTVDPSIVHEGARVFVARAAPIALTRDAAGPGRRDGALGAVLVLHDITDLHRADEIRRDFVANVSHELRTPLTAIRGYVEALQDEPADSTDRRKFLEIIARHADRMERLAADLLRLARLEAGHDRPEIAPCGVRDLFSGVVADLQSKMDDKAQRVSFEIDPAVTVVAADPQQLQEALENLVENAVIYSPAGTCITLGARRLDHRIGITVADEGPGIPQAALTRVFERFYRVDTARSREAGGTGLGLAIVKHIVERMEGTVRAGNRAGGGAIFTIELPLDVSVLREAPRV
jgi:two-component system phosphate regulon sensor histidine kinase PhoR